MASMNAPTKPQAADGDARPATGADACPPTPGTGAGSRPQRAPIWRQDDGAPVSCLEKIKVLNDNYAELQQMVQDAFEDALLMGCSEAQVRLVLGELIDTLHNPYPNATKSADQK
jgi:hypothetical protein